MNLTLLIIFFVAFLVIFFGIYWKSYNSTAAFWSSLVTMIMLAVFTLLELLGIWSISVYCHASIPGLIVAIILSIILTKTGKPRYYAEKDWNIDPEKGKREDVELNDYDLEVLSVMRDGMSTMVEIVDYMMKDSKFAAASVEKLDRGGYIRRKSLVGADFYTLSITQKGLDALPEQTAEEKALAEVHLTPTYLTYLKKLASSETEALAYLDEQGLGSMKAVSINSVLQRFRYVKQHGEIRRHYMATDAGRQVAEQF